MELALPSDSTLALPPVEAPPSAWRKLQQSYLARQAEQFEAGVPVSQLIQERSDFVDRILHQLWHSLFAGRTDLALLAVGGYGRSELHPYSDVDVLVLSAGKLDADTRSKLEAMITRFWDLGLEIGHSVRSIKECAREAKDDITVITNLIESRPIADDGQLHEQLRKAIAPKKMWPADRFFAAKLEEQQGRHGKYNETQYRLEPNLKDGAGGLRDVHTIDWVLRRAFNADIDTDLFTLGMMEKDECELLLKGRDFLWQVRFALHLLAGRHEERLLFEHQRELARQFGFIDEGGNLGVEQFMQRYFRMSTTLSRMNDLLLHHLQENLLHEKRSPKPVVIDDEFQTIKGFLEIRDPRLFERDPLALLRIFRVYQDHPDIDGIRADTIRAMRANRHRIAGIRDLPEAKKLFLGFFRAPFGLTHTLRLMHRYTILGRYLPAFKNVIGRMQFDMFHIYTVDQHTLSVVRNLRRFAVPKFYKEYPLCSEIITQIERPEVLYLAGLFHDIGKGRGGDHSKLGAEDARAFGQSHGLGEEDTELLSWLVLAHLRMSSVSQRQDISDPEVISTFAGEVGSLRRLQCLYVLTVADVRGTNPELFNSWRDSLLRELYRATYKVLQPDTETPADLGDKAEQARHQATRLLDEAGVPAQRYTQLWSNLPQDYFARYAPEEIAWQVQTLLADQSSGVYGIHLPEQKVRGGTAIFIHGPDRPGLFAKITAALEQLGLLTQEARITSTLDGRVLDSFIVLEASAQPVDDAQRRVEIRDLLAKKLAQPLPDNAPDMAPLERRIRTLFEPTRINLEHSHNATTLNIETNDRNGLLSAIARTLFDCGLHLLSARIATNGSRATDSFVVQNETANAIDETAIQCVKTRLISLLDE